eukprot:COSAG05_NODE_420_length_9974_cov_12.733975_3_plen_109_part_00
MQRARPPPPASQHYGRKCETCEKETLNIPDRKREQRHFFYFSLLLHGKTSEHIKQCLKKRRVKNQAQTKGDCTYALDGYAERACRPELSDLWVGPLGHGVDFMSSLRA